MNDIEIAILILILLMVLPDLCRRIGRPALTFAGYIFCGVILGPILSASASGLISALSHFGFILLLFCIGLETIVPTRSEIGYSLKKLLWTLLIQYPVIMLLGRIFGLTWSESLLAAASLSACSLSLAMPGVQRLPGLDEQRRRALITLMVILEIQAVVVLSVGNVVLSEGVGIILLSKIAGVVLLILFMVLVADHMSRNIKRIVEAATRWKVHLLVVLVLIIAAMGERAGLSAPKTAFFLGLFLSRTTHKGLAIEDHLAPVSHRLLIPVFFVYLGSLVHLSSLCSMAGIMGLAAAVFLLGIKKLLFAGFLPVEQKDRGFLALTPNLTIVAISAEILKNAGANSSSIEWLVTIGFFMSLIAVILLPQEKGGKNADGSSFPDQAPSFMNTGGALERKTPGQ